jgi:hypothetical protein
MTDETRKRFLLGASLLALAIIPLSLAWLLSPPPVPSGPVPVVWDKTACAQCRMHIGEPSFAAQLQTADRRVLDFDDPGCLFELLEAEQPEVAQIYFHHSEQERWLSRDQVGFVPHARTPMGYGLAAVERSRAGAIDFEQAAARVRTKRHAQHGGEP